MTRGWAELLQLLDDTIGVPLLVFGLLLLSVIGGALHYWYPRWIPTRFPRLRRSKRAKRAKKDTPEPEEVPEPAEEDLASSGDELPDLPARVFLSLADRLAAEGRYAEAVRERLRAIVRGLADRRAVEILPGMTVTEVALAAAAVEPAVESPLRGATGVFSDIWYGQVPATAEHDTLMRQYAAEVDA
ncbi:DUF4129 domain-containing protein [Dactylosporangium aurantiacum]|uniref:DUF4129 domain-containing protein n=1 Tax=Dactylosporangium aurantiacum TaxID=35754 RepID=A0A9Q9IEI4_9ACTN|nr:DUF4129 domain-containing protein [Dactylosporangium aurantiacum]MDG6108378.1 DUF4129 domain-containing protein [Dactylosporangium aurantiacum]UWZ53916.1 DUF4129 domain-containing protein [Dactylosporangium aurantiacum]